MAPGPLRPARAQQTRRAGRSIPRSRPHIRSGPADAPTRSRSCHRGRSWALAQRLRWGFRLAIPGGDQFPAKLDPGIVQRFVQAPARRPEALGQHVDRDLVEGQCDEHVSLMRGQLGPDGGGQHAEDLVRLLVSVACTDGRVCSRAGQACGSSVISRPCQARRRSLTPASSRANLYAQVVKRLAPR